MQNVQLNFHTKAYVSHSFGALKTMMHSIFHSISPSHFRWILCASCKCHFYSFHALRSALFSIPMSLVFICILFSASDYLHMFCLVWCRTHSHARNTNWDGNDGKSSTLESYIKFQSRSDTEFLAYDINKFSIALQTHIFGTIIGI